MPSYLRRVAIVPLAFYIVCPMPINIIYIIDLNANQKRIFVPDYVPQNWSLPSAALVTFRL